MSEERERLNNLEVGLQEMGERLDNLSGRLNEAIEKLEHYADRAVERAKDDLAYDVRVNESKIHDLEREVEDLKRYSR